MLRLLQVITHALTLAEMQAFLQRRRDEDNAFQEEINNLSEAIEKYSSSVYPSDNERQNNEKV